MDYPIDYTQYTKEEIIELVSFLHSIEQYALDPKSVSQTELIKHHKTFCTILNNRSEEKRIDKLFKNQTGFSIYDIITKIKEQYNQ